MINITFDGKEYSSSGYRIPAHGEYYLSSGNWVHQATGDNDTGGSIRLIVKPVSVEHTFGGVVYREGETRIATNKDCWLSPTGGHLTCGYASMGKRVILHPVRMEAKSLFIMSHPPTLTTPDPNFEFDPNPSGAMATGELTLRPAGKLMICCDGNLPVGDVCLLCGCRIGGGYTFRCTTHSLDTPE